MKALLSLTMGAIAVALLAGCGARDGDSHHGHRHEAPHGGTLVELGDHEFNLELVLDGTEGRLTAYVLGAHADEFVRIPVESFEVTAALADRTETLVFKAAANAKTGETVGNTSQFEAQADWLKTVGVFDGTLKKLEIKGLKYEGLKFKFPRNG